MIECEAQGCRYFQTSCLTCGKVVCTKTFPAPSEWISVKDRLPEISYKEKKSHIWIIGFDSKTNFVGEVIFRPLVCYNEQENKEEIVGYIFHDFCRKCLDGESRNITHWMHLPAPPKE